MMLTNNICDDETPTAFKFETSQLELSIKARNYLIIFIVPSNQFMPSCQDNNFHLQQNCS